MRIPKIYLETTIFNHYFDSERDAHVYTVKLFEEIRASKYYAYTSSYVIDELIQAEEPKQSNMLALIAKYNITVLDAADEAQNLTDIYIGEGVIPVKYRYDGLHIAIATINDLEYIFSLNFKHINKVKTKTMTSLINVRQGYKPILILTPMEVTENDEN
jgi:predicted nucleic acid-binding protein